MALNDSLNPICYEPFTNIATPLDGAMMVGQNKLIQLKPVSEENFSIIYENLQLKG